MVAGDEPLIHLEACDAVRRVARERGIEEREVMHVESGFQWTQLLESASSLSLFASSKLIEVRLGGQSPGQDGGKALEAYAEQAALLACAIMTCASMRLCIFVVRMPNAPIHSARFAGHRLVLFKNVNSPQ